MKFLHYDVFLNYGEAVRVDLDAQANVCLMDSFNFQNYRAGRSFRYHGGKAERSPVVLRAPHAGQWHVVIDLGGYAGQVSASVNVIR